MAATARPIVPRAKGNGPENSNESGNNSRSYIGREAAPPLLAKATNGEQDRNIVLNSFFIHYT